MAERARAVSRADCHTVARGVVIPPGTMRSIPLARRSAAVVLLSLAVTAGACDKSKSSPSSPAGAAAFASSPFLPLVPADTPYVMATFKPVPMEYWARIAPMLKSITTPLMADADTDPDAKKFLESLSAEIGPDFNAKRAVELGLSPEARFAVYGLGVYPVFRFEIADGDRLFATIERLATANGEKLDAPIVRDGYRVWKHAEGSGPAGILAIGKTEAVGALVPQAEVDAYIPKVLGVEKPAKSLPVETLAEAAQRHGFSAYGVGFVDSTRLATLVVPAEMPPACKSAILDITRSAPRLVAGYGDLSQPVIEGGLVIELAPELVKELKGIAAATPGASSVVTSEPLFAMAIAADINKARPLLGRLGQALTTLNTACPDAELAEAATGLAQAAVAPLPPALTSIRGGVISVKDVTMQPGGSVPTAFDGYAAVWSDDAPALFAMAAGMVPPLASLDLKPDGTPREVMPGTLPFPVFASLSKNAIAVSSGEAGAKGAKAALDGKADPAPLLLLHYDYGRFFQFAADMNANDPAQAATTQMMRDWSKIFGPSTMEFLVDDRGFVMWFKMALR
jgi:hypothetical protein